MTILTEVHEPIGKGKTIRWLFSAGYFDRPLVQVQVGRGEDDRHGDDD